MNSTSHAILNSFESSSDNTKVSFFQLGQKFDLKDLGEFKLLCDLTKQTGAIYASISKLAKEYFKKDWKTTKAILEKFKQAGLIFYDFKQGQRKGHITIPFIIQKGSLFVKNPHEYYEQTVDLTSPQLLLNFWKTSGELMENGLIYKNKKIKEEEGSSKFSFKASNTESVSEKPIQSVLEDEIVKDIKIRPAAELLEKIEAIAESKQVSYSSSERNLNINALRDLLENQSASQIEQYFKKALDCEKHKTAITNSKFGVRNFVDRYKSIKQLHQQSVLKDIRDKEKQEIPKCSAPVELFAPKYGIIKEENPHLVDNMRDVATITRNLSEQLMLQAATKEAKIPVTRAKIAFERYKEDGLTNIFAVKLFSNSQIKLLRALFDSAGILVRKEKAA